MPKINLCWLVLTYNCNSKCTWCYAKSDIEQFKKETMDYNLAVSLVDFIKDLGLNEIILIGGEPTLYPRLFDLIEYSKTKEIKTILITNGIKLNDINFVEQLKDCGLYSVNTSIEGSNSFIHNEITQTSGSFNKTINGIRNCIEINLPVSTTMTISSINKHDVLNVVDLLLNLGLNYGSFNICTPSINYSYSADFTPSLEEIAETIEKIYIYTKERNFRPTFITPFPLCKLKKDILSDMIRDNNEGNIKLGGCHTFFGVGLVIDYDGKILPCTHCTGIFLGSLLKDDENLMSIESFYNYWDHSTPLEFRNKLGVFPSESCVNCQYWKKCQGGCPLLWLKFEGPIEI